MLTFVDNSNFYFVEDGSSVLDPSGRDGIERGTYTKSATSFTAVASVNTNGEWGVSGSAIPYSISNNLLTMGSNPDTATFAKIVSNPDNPLIGSWYGTNLGQAKSSAVLTFVDNSTFLFAEDGSSALDPSGQDGMERGTYSRTATTWMPVVSVNTNGEWGFSGTSAVAYAISNNVLTLTVGPDTVSFTRVQ
ncbi:MAG: hypothetical protein A2075_18175 [Geobacteraceae bacterium GWC2_58_44]|nr:MAG: hypothetical protein A2075_18175 [Geobacteraceae bacterium GWC2_58_44]HBG05450.1 hypothetical protein [Geobacter sp.]